MSVQYIALFSDNEHSVWLNTNAVHVTCTHDFIERF